MPQIQLYTKVVIVARTSVGWLPSVDRLSAARGGRKAGRLCTGFEPPANPASAFFSHRLHLYSQSNHEQPASVFPFLPSFNSLPSLPSPFQDDEHPANPYYPRARRFAGSSSSSSSHLLMWLSRPRYARRHARGRRHLLRSARAPLQNPIYPREPWTWGVVGAPAAVAFVGRALRERRRDPGLSPLLDEGGHCAVHEAQGEI